jgi:predicted dehydrogenase
VGTDHEAARMAPAIAIVGLGARGLAWAGEVRSNGAFELVAGVEPDPNARVAAERSLGLGPGAVHADIEPVLERDDVRAVIVVTPPEHHEAASRKALEAGRAVLVEKPFTLDLDAAVGLVELAEARGAALLVAQTYRYLRVHKAARAVVRSGRLGPVRQVACRHFRIEPAPAIGGDHGALWDLGVHHLDAIRDLLGAEPVAVLATSFDGGLSTQALLDFGDGRRASYSATRRSSGHEFFEGGKEHYMRVVGERGTLHVLHRWLVLCESGKLPRPLRRGPRQRTEEAQLLDDFARALSGPPPEGLSGRDNIGTMAILDACVRSAEERRWVAPRGLDG